jgi:hypothetical protein
MRSEKNAAFLRWVARADDEALRRKAAEEALRTGKSGTIVEARRESRPRRGCHIDARTESERGSEQGGILVRGCRDLRRPVL